MKKPLPDQIREAKEKIAELDSQITAALEKAGTDEFTPEIRSLAISGRQTMTDLKMQLAHLEEQEKKERSSSITTAIIPGLVFDKNVHSSFRLVRGISAMLAGKTADGLEKEIHEEGVKEMRGAGIETDASGLIVPGSMFKRDLLVGTSSAGGATVATDLGELIPFLDPSLTLRTLGASVLSDLKGNLDLPRRTSRATATHLTETGTSTESSPTVDKLSLMPKRQGTYIEVSEMLLRQSSVDVENLIRLDLQRAVWELQEVAAINGSGTAPNPTGILNTVGIGSVIGGTNGAVPDWEDFVDLETALSGSNAINGKLGYLTTPGMAGRLKKTLVASSAGSEHIWEGPNNGQGMINFYPALTSTLVPSNLVKGTSSNCHAIIFGNWTELILAFWGGAQIIVNPYSLDREGMTRVVVNSYFDCGLRHLESFSAFKDALIQ